ncbi:laminin subunit alpha-1 isoform X2 [Neopsephotus bourkii]|uniref:laminin subunit alpha-1 isoform X2 n=1 Tax=Neopsephotus bourkii TaxID=309878 RepID=UPI002AA4F736|nr:laminin subunit alpha-1 isoform X2 [Neopsephotus bourkii]
MGSGDGRLLAVLAAASLLWVSGQGQPRGLFPAILNLASNAHISTNATCGEKGPEMFCKLVEHVPGRPLRNAQCRVCDHHSANPKEQHPISSAIDGTNNWWQSPSIQNGRQYHWVTITLDLRQVFQVAYVIIKAANAPRPGNWILERSIDGTEFRPWQYYAISDTECLTRYNITPRIGPPTYKRDDEVICTSYYSRLVPLEHGEIHTSLINGRPSADDPSQKLLEFTSARYIRLRLQRIRTLNADLMTLSHNDPKELDPIVTRRYYYSIKDISVGGMCICYGHARSCPLDEITKKLQCQCEHNTCGESCNKCCPGYHQKPWRPGTISAGNKCEKCNCHNKAEDCYYSQSIADQKRSMDVHGQYIGGGVCLNCTQHTTGINCEMCADGYFRPNKVSPYEDHPCYPCNCDPFGSLSSDCIKDEHHSDSQRGARPGQCQCREGYTGEKCDHCAFGYRGYPNCQRCNCSLIGSINEDPCTEPCVCKENVEGENCDLCKPGFYNLQERNPQGCTECFCFGVSDVCDSLTWPISQISDMTGWLVTDLYNTKSVQPQRSQFDGPRQISINNTEAVKVLKHTYYWSAPETYLGNKLTAFGGELKYTVSYDIPMESVDSDIVSSVDVIIQGNGQILSTRAAGLSLQPYEEYSNTVRFVAENFIEFNTKKAIDREKLMTVLVNMTHLLIRANYNIAKKAVYRLDSVTLDTANENVIDLSSAPDVEFCECPQSYTGISCESCLPGYYRVDGILFGGICQPCKCNGHATECDIHGVCFACQHNTTGPFCDQCLPGFYGNPSQGTSEDCHPCACPLSSAANNFSPTCQLSEGVGIVCDNCLPGYTGSQCERCANGYYGNPLMPGQSCAPCECNGNVNPEEDGHCDTFTGQCLKCLGNTAGHHCEKCADGYYGDAVIEKNCHACACHVNGSLSTTCHHETGFCQCKSNVIGERCDKCLNGYYGLLTGLGCIPCNCSQFGSVSEDCNHEGQCHCVPGVTGEKCDRCAHGFHMFQDGGCTPCNCAHTQNNCNADSGQCICPPHTQGPKCELCEEYHWGLSPKFGCKACNCSTTGSANLQCDVLTGQCQCKVEYGGQDCSRCALGYRDYPDCVACDCDLSGTKAEMCDDTEGLCGCEEETGICTCKENVFGLQCSECKPGTFALSAGNALGCTPCFCFGMSTFCSELEDHVRIPITLTPDQSILHVVAQSNLTGTVEGVFSQFPDVLLDATIVRKYLNTETFYWRLPEQFQGDQLMAYGGKLRYTVAFYALDGFGTSNFEPQILMKGGHTSKFVIYVDIPSPENGVRTDKEVEMKEDSWKYFNSVSDEPVLRSDFMSVLSNVEYILIKAAYGQGLQQSRIANISMEIAVKFEEMHLGRARARLVEQCRCPSGYAGLSCQSCAPGYYRGKHTELGVKELHTLIAPCVPCQCHNHSDTCDPETGKCLNCRDNTVGDYCSACAPGYYGKVTGSANDCSLCACPRANPVSFSPTCVLKGVQDYHCDACLPGYEGQYCERCSLGYYGDPQFPGGSCHQCQCNPSGSVHANCDRVTGQCLCKQGVTGQLCEECEPRHLLVEDKCVSCDDNCTGVLLNTLDDLSKDMLSLNLTGVARVPYGTLSQVENATKHLKESIVPREDSTYSIATTEESLQSLSRGVDQLHKESSRFLKKAWQLNTITQATRNKSQELTGFIDTVHTTIKVLAEVAMSLNETLGLDLPLSNATSQSLQDDISALLDALRRKDFVQQHHNATRVLKAAENLLIQVQREYLKPQKELADLKSDAHQLLSKHNNRLQDAQDLVNEALANINETNRLFPLMSSNLAELNDKKLNIKEGEEISTILINEGKVLVNSATTLAQEMKNSTSNLEVHQDGLVLWSTKLRHHVDDLVMQMSVRGVLDLVYRAEDHATQIQRLADALESGLSKVRNVTLNTTAAVYTHSSVKNVIEVTESLADDASRVVNAPLDFPEESLSLLGKEILLLSSKFQNEAKNLKKRSDGLLFGLNGMNKKVEKIQESTNKIVNQLNDSLVTLRALPNATRKYMLEVKELAVSANTSAVVGLNHFGDFSQKLLNTSSALSQVNDTLRKATELITDSSKAAITAEKQVKEVEAQASLLLDRLKPLKMLEENLSRNLSEIKELISQARKQAASIKVAVSADRDCIRAYQPQISSTNYNTLTLNVKTTEPDNLLFYLGSNGKADFLAVEMRRGKVALLWDLGSGSARVEYPDFQIDNNKWHRIHATRFGKTGTLSIEEMNSNQKPSSKSATSPGTASVLDVNKSTLMFIGGLGGQIKKSPAVKVTHFKGCMGEASLNGKSIGLWNYMEKEGKCNGCFGSPQDEDTSFHFDGSGYSVVEKSLRSTVTQIIIFFSTFSPNGLLLYLASNGTRDFLSLELVDGKVRLTVDLGSGPLALTTENRYNNGTWYKISFSRNKKQGILAVMDAYNLNYKETKQGESPGVASDLNRSDKDPIFIGGLPRSRIVRKGLNSRRYVGCIKNLEISRSTFDLLRNSYGVRKGCVLEPIRTVNILNNGYIELVSKSLSPDSELMATFATKNSSGIILAGLSRGLEKRRRRQAHLPFFSIMLMDGHLVVHVNAGDRASTRKVVLQSAHGTYSDGQEHSVILIRSKRIITVQVDESNPAELRLGGSAEMTSINISNFYAGGIPAGEGVLGLKMAGSFYGCISNIIFNKELLYFTTSMKYEHVDMDSCFLSEKPKPAIPEDTEIQPELRALPVPLRPFTDTKKVVCAKDELPDHVQGAHQFGLAKGSHMTLLFNQSIVRKKLSVQLSLRSFASSGLIYYMAHQNQADYAALQLHGGQLYFSFDLGKGKAVAFHPAVISDGKWHTVKTEYVKRKGIIIVDGQELVAVTALGDGSTLDVEGKLYMGGLPLDYVPKNLGNVTHSIPACIGNMTINSKQLDKESPVSIFAVNKCYVTVQDGTFFDGSGFVALVREGYKVRSDVNITLEFRTTAVHGVLLGVSSAKVDAIGLEIVNGKVLFHVNNGAGRITATYEPRGTNSLCDGKWHKLQANKSKHRISLIIDGNLVQTDNPYLQSTSADTNNPIYVGGYPADVKQNCLTSKSSFRGCLRNLVLSKGQQAELFDFSRAFDLRGAFPHSCPGTEH